MAQSLARTNTSILGALREGLEGAADATGPSARALSYLRRPWFPAVNVAITLLIAAADWMTPAGIVVGILLTIPIILTSFWDDRRLVWVTTGIAIVGFVIAAYFGADPISPPTVWVPNRVFAFLSLPASYLVARALQERRLLETRAREQAMAASELNRLLMSLLAHDLRAPLATASQAFQYVENAVSQGRNVDLEILSDLGARLQRSLRAIDIVLALTRGSLAEERSGADAQAQDAVDAAELIESEVATFAVEAAARGKVLEVDVGQLGRRPYRLEARVLRQTLSILLDNAIRYAVPGPVRVSGTTAGAELQVRIMDQGPGLAASRDRKDRGTGLGLELCRLLASYAGGALEIERDGPSGCTFLLRLPAPPSGPSGR